MAFTGESVVMINHLLSNSNRIFLILILVLVTAPALAVDTRIDVRVISRGAKFIGTSMGGVHVTVRDAHTGELLAKGKTSGSTGDTERIMKEAHKRNSTLATPDAAVFSTYIDISEPRKIEVTARGPLAQRQAANTISATQWVIPGKHLSGGNGWLLEMPGFVVDVLDPPAHKGLSGVPQDITVTANVTKMCGCPITPGGLWDADEYEVRALVRRNGESLPDLPLEYAGESSQFTGTLTVSRPGTYEITVYAFDSESGNTGIDTTTVNVSPD